MAITLSPEEKVLRQGAKRASESGNQRLMETYSAQLDKSITDRDGFSQPDKKTTQEARRAVRQIQAGPRAVSNGQPSAPITSQNLAPRQEATLATPVTPTAAPTLQSEIQASTDQFTANLEAQAAALKPAATSGIQSYIDQLSQSRGITGLTDTAYRQEGGVDDIQVELNDINDQIRKEQRALDLATRRVEEAGGGLAGGAAAEIQNLRSDSLKRQADLSIIQQGVQGRYDSAKAIADRAVSAQLEQQTNDLAIAKFNYEENKELFNKAEQRAFESKVADRERMLTEQKENKTAIYDLAIQAQQDGAPTAVVQSMMAADTKEKAAELGGSYIGALDRQAQQESILTAQAQRANIYDQMNARQAAIRAEAQTATTEQDARQLELQAETEQALELRTLAQELKEMRGMGAAVGFGFGKSVRGSIPFVGEGAISGSARADFEALAERAANLLTLDNLDLMSGVLSETDIKILESSGSNLRNFSQSEDQYMKEVDRIINVMNRTIDSNGITPEQAVFWGALEPTDVDTFNSIWETL